MESRFSTHYRKDNPNGITPHNPDADKDDVVINLL